MFKFSQRCFVVFYTLIRGYFRYSKIVPFLLSQSVTTVEYTDCTSAEGLDSPNKCPGYDTKQSDGEVPVMLGHREYKAPLRLPLLPGPLWPEW